MTAWPDAITFTQTWMRSVERGPSRQFLVFEAPDGTTASWTYAEFDELIGRCAALLNELHVRPGSAVSVALTNSPAFVAIWLATIRLGAWLVPSDPMAAVPELAAHIARTRPVIGFCAVTRAETYRAAAADAHMHLVEVDEADSTLAVFGETVFGETVFGSTAFGAGIRTGWPTPALTDRAAVMFTSGTTGVPKGVEVTQANYAFAGATMAAASGLQPDDRQLVVLPLFHANAQFYSFASAIWVGASVALMHTFSASGFVGQAARHRATHASLFAAPIRMILNRGATPIDGVALRHCWYAMNITDDQHRTLAALLGCAPRQLYGMTETIPAVLCEAAIDPVPESMGFPTQGCVVEVHESASGDGEIVVGGEPGITLFAGYLDDPVTTAASFRDGWFQTGDRAHVRADGRFIFDGRHSDVLKVAGENVSTIEVERVIAAFPGVLDVAVVGHPDAIRDEVPVAFIVASDPMSPPDLAALDLWCEQRLTKAKRPRNVTLVEQLPRTSVGKIRSFMLRDAGAESRVPR
jgi:crotonobetaine/carnitine-CoA ligase